MLGGHDGVEYVVEDDGAREGRREDGDELEQLGDERVDGNLPGVLQEEEEGGLNDEK